MDDVTVLVRFGPSVCSLGVGSECALGRGAPDVPADICPSDALDLSRRAAIVVHASPGRWAVHAVSAKNGVLVRHRGGSSIRVPHGETLEMPEWFDDAYLLIITPSEEHEIRVQVVGGVAPSSLPRRQRSINATTAIVLPRDPERADFRTAVLLCEPMLLDPFNRRVPTEGEVAARLVALAIEAKDVAARTVERRLARLRARLQVASNAELRDRLVAACVVTTDDLDLIREVRSR